jgi:hypothetical protein
MYDKAITLDCGLYYVQARRDDDFKLYGPFVTFEAARATYDRLPSVEEDSFTGTAKTLEVDPRREWFEEKLEREDLFEEFVAEAEYAYCR